MPSHDRIGVTSWTPSHISDGGTTRRSSLSRFAERSLTSVVKVWRDRSGSVTVPAEAQRATRRGRSCQRRARAHEIIRACRDLQRLTVFPARRETPTNGRRRHGGHLLTGFPSWSHHLTQHHHLARHGHAGAECYRAVTQQKAAGKPPARSRRRSSDQSSLRRKRARAACTVAATAFASPHDAPIAGRHPGSHRVDEQRSAGSGLARPTELSSSPSSDDQRLLVEPQRSSHHSKRTWPKR